MERFSIRLPGKADLQLGERTLVMGILNITPDSFSDGGRYLDADAAIERGLEMVGEGADLIDIGGESTRPGAAPVSPDEEMQRVLPVVQALAAQTNLPLSIDTRHGETARAALHAGATILNDVTGMRDPSAASAAADTGAAVILMHMRGTPADMRERAVYSDLLGEVREELQGRIDAAVGAGIDPSRIILDPGIGFAKDADQSMELIRNLGALGSLGHALLVGPSRKSFLAAIEETAPTERRDLTLGAVAACAANGAHIVRVHDVRSTVQVLRAFEALSR